MKTKLERATQMEEVCGHNFTSKHRNLYQTFIVYFLRIMRQHAPKLFSERTFLLGA